MSAKAQVGVLSWDKQRVAGKTRIKPEVRSNKQSNSCFRAALSKQGQMLGAGGLMIPTALLCCVCVTRNWAQCNSDVIYMRGIPKSSVTGVQKGARRRSKYQCS